MHNTQSGALNVLMLCSSRGKASTVLLFCIIHRHYVSMLYALDLCKHSYRSSLTSVLSLFVMNNSCTRRELDNRCLLIGKTDDDARWRLNTYLLALRTVLDFRATSWARNIVRRPIIQRKASVHAKPCDALNKLLLIPTYQKKMVHEKACG